ncbi:MAG TPA: PAS domain-containing protein [bacterium]
MRIGARLALGLAAVLVGGGLVGGGVYYAVESEHEQHKLEVVARLVAEQAFLRIEARMRSHRGALAADALGKLELPASVNRVFIVNAAGTVRSSTDPALQGRVLARDAAGCGGCHGGGGSVAVGALRRWARPLSATGACAECHRAAGGPLGCLVVDLDLGEYNREVAEQIGTALAMLAALLALAGAGTLIVTRRWITGRLDALGLVMQRFEGGDLGVRAPITGRDEISRVEAGFNRMAGTVQAREREGVALLGRLNAANEELRRGEERLRRTLDAQRVVNDVLRLSLGEQRLEAVLQRALELVLAIPWLTVEPRGSIFLVEDGALVMRAHSGLDPRLAEACARVPFGHCLCGRAAAQGHVVHAADLDERHDTRYAGMPAHGHYCVPILSLGREVLGVLNLYLGPGHAESPAEVEFLTAVANTLASVIRRSVAERRLRKSEQRFRTLAEAASDTIFIVDPEQRLAFINGTGARLFGTTPEHLTGRRVAEFVPPEARATVAAALEAALRGEDGGAREDHFAFPAGEVWLGTTLVALPDAGGVFGISRDITGQRQAQAERERLIAELQALLEVVSQSHQEWQGTFDGITDMISILDGDARIVKVNRAYAAYFGAHPRDLIGRDCRDFCLAGHQGAAGCPLVRQARRGEAVNEEVLDPRTGRVFRYSIFPYASGEGAINRFVHLVEDVSVEREREQRLIMSERLAALGQMASGIAHEINNPLASIGGCAEALLRRLERGQIDPALFADYLGIVHEEVFRCKKITTAMLSFVRPGGAEDAAVAPHEALERAVELIGFQGRLQAVEVVREYPGDLPAVRVREDEMRQVLLIVLTNALDAMQEVGTLRLGGAAHEGGVTLSICDSGPGIAPEAAGKLFTPFFTTKGNRGGTGLGLSIARRIIEERQGSIAIESPPGGGVTVRITFPTA